MEQQEIILKVWRGEVDDKYLGFHPNGTSIKPVHVAGGVFRAIYGKIANTIQIKRLSYVSNAKGETPPNNILYKVKQSLLAEDKIESNIEDNDLESLRNLMQKLLSVDKGVFSGEKDGMVSYSAGSKYFITNRATYEDAGETIGSIINSYCPELAQYIKNILDEALDPISLLFKPVESNEFSIPSTATIEVNFPQENPTFIWFTNSLKQSSLCLIDNLKNHPNKLSQLRLFILFCIFSLIRLMSLLEGFYVPGEKDKKIIRPFVVDFSNKSGSNIANLSELSFTQVHRSISRFYSWAFSEMLSRYNITEFDPISCPKYDKSSKKSKKDGSEEIWKYAIEKAEKETNIQSRRSIIGEAIYDLLALEGTSYPVKYVKSLGVKSGVLYPQHEGHPNKRFIFSQDVIEMIMKCCIDSGEVITNMELRERLWDRFGIIIGGSTFELSNLESNSTITHIDNSSLEKNFDNFAKVLEEMDLAEMLADGILQIRIGNYD